MTCWKEEALTVRQRKYPTLFGAIAKKQWPEYSRKTKSGKNEQNDATEYLMRIMGRLEEEDKDNLNQATLEINSSIRCTNENCTAPIDFSIQKEQILRTSKIPNDSRISLQAIMDNFHTPAIQGK